MAPIKMTALWWGYRNKRNTNTYILYTAKGKTKKYLLTRIHFLLYSADLSPEVRDHGIYSKQTIVRYNYELLTSVLYPHHHTLP